MPKGRRSRIRHVRHTRRHARARNLADRGRLGRMTVTVWLRG